MKKIIATLVFCLAVSGALVGQNRIPCDVVLAVETSSLMHQYYKDSCAYITGPLIVAELAVGDTVHLISYSRSARLELARRIETSGDIEALIARVFLLYPLDSVVDRSAAFSFIGNYLQSLPSSRPKKAFIIGAPAAQGAAAIPESLTVEMNRRGWPLTYISPPYPAYAIPQRPAVSVQATPPATGQAPAHNAAGGAIDVPTASPGLQSTPAASSGETQGIAQLPSSVSETVNAQMGSQPETASTAPPASEPLETPGGLQEKNEPGASLVSLLPFVIGGIAAVLLLFALLFLVRRIRAHAEPDSAVQAQGDENQQMLNRFAERQAQNAHETVVTGKKEAYAGLTQADIRKQPEAEVQKTYRPADDDSTLLLSRFADRQAADARGIALVPRKEEYAGLPPSVKAPAAQTAQDDMVPIPAGSIRKEHERVMLNLYVEDQNTAIGRRNVHLMKSGTTLSVGGGNSDFWIFLVPLPARIAYINFDGENCTFYPRKSRFFPDTSVKSIPNCIGKTIHLRSDRGYDLYIRFERFEDPLRKLNDLLRSIETPVV